jgi:hypothetical protein
VLTDLGSVGEGYRLEHVFLNAFGIVLGNVFRQDETEKPSVVLFEEGAVTPLASFVENLGDWQLEEATGLADDGTIVVIAVRRIETAHQRNGPPPTPHIVMLVPIAGG